MRKLSPANLFLLSLAVALSLAGCGGPKPEVLTEANTGQRVASFDVDDAWVVYVWYPAQLRSTQGHLVVLNSETGDLTEIESDFTGPMAVSRGRLLYWNADGKDKENNADLILRDLPDGAPKTLAHERVRSLDLDGDLAVWEQVLEAESNIVLYDLASDQRKTVSIAQNAAAVSHRSPTVKDGVVAWEAYDRKTRTSSITIFDIAGDDLSSIDIDDARPSLSLSPGRLVYGLTRGTAREIHLYDLATTQDKIIAEPTRLSCPPVIERDTIAWCEHVPKEDFKGIPGQPLMDEKDIRDVFTYDIPSGRTKEISGDLLATGGRVAIHNGRIYLNVYRDYPPPGSSNLVVPVDLWRW